MQSWQGVLNLHWVVRFGEEAAPCGKFPFRDPFTPRSHDDLDRWPSVADRVGELEAIHRARHVNVGEDHADVPAVLQDPYGFIGVGGFDDRESRRLDRFDGAKPNQRLIFDDEDGWSFRAGTRSHALPLMSFYTTLARLSSVQANV